MSQLIPPANQITASTNGQAAFPPIHEIAFILVHNHFQILPHGVLDRMQCAKSEC